MKNFQYIILVFIANSILCNQEFLKIQEKTQKKGIFSFFTQLLTPSSDKVHELKQIQNDDKFSLKQQMIDLERDIKIMKNGKVLLELK